MKILLTNNQLADVGGSETWTRTMAHELQRQGHDITIFTLNRGYFSELLESEGLVVIDSLNGLESSFGLAIVNHITMLALVKINLEFTPIIFTSHSSFIDIERPIGGALHYVAVTEECVDKNYYTTIIRNGIDLDKFSYSKPNKKLEKILYLSHPWNKLGDDLVKEACKDYDLTLISTPIIDTEALIKEADLVITLGRGILESLACGKNVISGDHRDWMDGFMGAGMITEDNFDKLKTHALSGRNYPKKFTVDSLRHELDKYDAMRNLRHKIEEEYDIEKQVKQYLNLIK